MPVAACLLVELSSVIAIPETFC